MSDTDLARVIPYRTSQKLWTGAECENLPNGSAVLLRRMPDSQGINMVPIRTSSAVVRTSDGWQGHLIDPDEHESLLPEALFECLWTPVGPA